MMDISEIIQAANANYIDINSIKALKLIVELATIIEKQQKEIKQLQEKHNFW